MAGSVARFTVIMGALALLLNCGGASTNADMGSPSATPTPSAGLNIEPRYYAVYEAYVGATDEVLIQAQLTRDSEPSANNDAGIYLATDGEPVTALWASVGESVNRLAVSSDVFDSILEYAGQLVRLTPGSFSTSFFNSLLNVNQRWYTAELPYQAAELYYLTAELNDGTFLDQSTVVLPAAFAIQPLPEQFSRSSDVVTVSWEPKEADVEVRVQALTACQATEALHIQFLQQEYDQGFATFEAGSLADESLSGSCITTFVVIKTRIGELDTFFAGGRITGNQYRSKATTSNP